MNANRLWTIGAVVVILALVAGTWFIGISPRLTEIAAAETSKQSVVAINAAHDVTLKHLQELDAKLPELKKDLDELHESISVEAEQANFVRNVESAAAAAGMQDLFQQYDGATFFVAPAELPSDPELSAAIQSVGEAKLVVIPVLISATGTRAQTFAWIDRLQKSTRLFLLHDVAFSDGYGALDDVVEASIEGQIFVFLDEALAGAVVDAGSGGATVPPSSDSGPQPE